MTVLGFIQVEGTKKRLRPKITSIDVVKNDMSITKVERVGH